MTSSQGGEFRGKTVDEAIDAGLNVLGLNASQVEVEVLSKGNRGLLGFGAEDARVLITPIGKKPAPKADKPVSREPAPPPKPAVPPSKPVAPPPKPVAPPPPPKPQPSVKAEKPAPAASSVATDGEEELDATEVAKDILQGMLDRMDLNATVQPIEYRGVLDEGQDPPIILNVEGEDLGILIGRRAETLGAIQYLTRLMVNHRVRRWVNIVVDVEGYRTRREEQLMRLANRMADRVASTGKPVSLETMPPNERRIVHIALRENPHVWTESSGEGEHRKVTIYPKE